MSLHDVIESQRIEINDLRRQLEASQQELRNKTEALEAYLKALENKSPMRIESQLKQTQKALRMFLEMTDAVRKGNNRRAMTRMYEIEAMITYEKLLED